MSILSNLNTDTTIEESGDSLGGFSLLDSDLYNSEIEVAYLSTSKGGAISLTVHLKIDKHVHKETFWITSGTAKGCKTYYEDKKGNRHFLPGYSQANHLCLLAIGKEITSLEDEEKVINIYNPELKKEAPTKVKMLTDLVGAEITAGIVKQTVDKTVKNDNFDSSKPQSKENQQYVPTGETREKNEVSKFFRAKDGLTVAEIKAGETDAVFKEKWEAKYKGEVINKAKGVAASTGVTSGAPKAATPTESIFG